MRKHGILEDALAGSVHDPEVVLGIGVTLLGGQPAAGAAPTLRYGPAGDSAPRRRRGKPQYRTQPRPPPSYSMTV